MRSTNLFIFIIALIVTLSSGIKMKKGNLLTSPVISTGLTNIKYQPTTSGIVTQANPSLYGYGYSNYPYYSSSSTIAQVDPYMINYGYSPLSTYGQYYYSSPVGSYIHYPQYVSSIYGSGSEGQFF